MDETDFAVNLIFISVFAITVFCCITIRISEDKFKEVKVRKLVSRWSPQYISFIEIWHKYMYLKQIFETELKAKRDEQTEGQEDWYDTNYMSWLCA